MDYNDPKVKQAAEVLQSFLSVSRASARLTQQNAASLGITLHQLGALNTLYSNPGLTLKELTEKLGSSKSTISVAIDGLVGLGLVERKTSPEDRREVQLSITPEGRAVSVKSSQNALSYKAMQSALGKMPQEDIGMLLRLHAMILNSIEQYAPSES